MRLWRAPRFTSGKRPRRAAVCGDGHAAQGDGELNGNALETSMDVEFTVDVIPGKADYQSKSRVGHSYHGDGAGRVA